MKIEMTPIGVVEEVEEPAEKTERFINRREKLRINPEFREGLTWLEPGQKIQVLFYFHKSKGWENITYSYGQNKTTGVFNTHSPNRPNGIGVTAVDLLAMEDGVLTVDGADMMEGTPILDIKPMPHGGKP